MRPSIALNNHRDDIRRIVEAHHAINPRVFGSIVHGNDTDNSDLDILVDPISSTTLMDIAAIQVELELLLGVAVDVLTPRALPVKLRTIVLGEAQPI